MADNRHNNYNNEETPIYDELTTERSFPWGKLAVFFILLGACLFGLGWLSGSRGGRVYFSGGVRVISHSQVVEEHGEQAMDMIFGSHINAITANTVSNGIVFIPTSGNEIRVTYANHREVSVNEVDGRLHVDVRIANSTTTFGGIVTRRQFLNFGRQGVSWNRVNDTRFLEFNFDFANFSVTSNAVRIYVPSSVLDIEARSVSGSVRIDGVNTTNLNLQTTSGRVTVEGGTHENSHLRSTSGSVNANAYFAGDLYARSTSGSVNITDRSTLHRHVAGSEGIRLRSTSGSVNFSTRAEISDFRYNVSVVSGSMRVDGSRVSGRRASGGSGAVPLDVSTTSGSVRVSFGQ